MCVLISLESLNIFYLTFNTLYVQPHFPNFMTVETTVYWLLNNITYQST